MTDEIKIPEESNLNVENKRNTRRRRNYSKEGEKTEKRSYNNKEEKTLQNIKEGEKPKRRSKNS